MSNLNGCVVGDYLLDYKIGSGTFGVVYLGTNMISGEKVAIKLESRTVRNPKLALEYMIYRILANGKGIPHVHWFGRVGKYNALVMDVLGPSLHDLFKFCKCKFTLRTVLLLADQLLSRIEYVHENNIIHRDIKPSNFVMGLKMNELNQVYIIDFGLAKTYRNPITQQHISCVETNTLTGSIKYASINSHLGIQQTRRDDLESLGNTLVLFALGKLPWQDMRARNRKELNNQIMQMKINTPVESLCEFLPAEFATYMNYCRVLTFNEKPKYNILRRLFRKLFIRKGFCDDHIFDWTLLNTGSTEMKNTDSTDFCEWQLNRKDETNIGGTHNYKHSCRASTEFNHRVGTLALAAYV